jgi:phosphoribosylformylglycinamidine cyclo-ligase
VPDAVGWTYARSGVDRASIATAVEALLKASRAPTAPGAGIRIAAPGHYAGLLKLGPTTLAVTTDTVGTKSLLAETTGRWEEIGEDAVGVNTNDLASVGARPAGLVDTILCKAPDPARFAAIGRGIGLGLRKAKCHLLGGETAVVPELVQGIDVGGTAIGFFPDGRRPVLGDRIRAGDKILGLPSDGFHANGYTLLRRLLSEEHVDLHRRRPGARRNLGEELMRPTKIYARPIEAIADDPAVHGLAHISGGGVRNLVRLRPEARFSLDLWPRPKGLFEWLVDLGGLELEDAYETFNMGIGFVVVVEPGAATRLLARLKAHGAPDALEVGTVETGRGVALPSLGLEYRGYS